MKKIWNDFKAFALKGNVLDMAVGVIVGGAFGKIVSSVVNDLVMPLFGYLVSGMDFASLKLVLSPAQLDEAGAVLKPEAAILYGSFIQNVVDFFLISLCIFLFTRLLGKLSRRKKEEEPAAPPAPPAPTAEELLTEIRDLLKAQSGEESGE